ncbi:MAG: serine/threonine-protein kinase [Cyanobacteria bacterium J06600_6]
MSRASTSALRDGVILNNRYRIVKQIGRGGFGRAYLAEDTQRYRELCVLKEFAPQVDRDDELRQAEDLFEREAGILYKLSHQQIPRFEALLRTKIDGRRSLFLVQEYVPGKSYWELLLRRDRLTEAEVVSMFEDILPILDYIHLSELIHRDISPDNLILRDDDAKAVLIDFGCVKLAANAVSRSRGHAITLIGKKGYSPDEQLSRGQAMPSSDLYSLAATAVVLLTGKQPDKLYDSHLGRWDWNQIEASSEFKKILKKMLADRPCDRYQSAEQVLQVLAKTEKSPINSFISRCRTLILAPANERTEKSGTSSFATKNYHPQSRRQAGFNDKIARQTKKTLQMLTVNFRRAKPWHWGLIAAGIILIPGLISFVLINYRITKTVTIDFERNSQDFVLSQNELDFQRQIHQRVESLDIDASVFYKRVDTIFHQQHPELAGKTLTERGDHQEYREEWYQIATSLLTRKERSR